MALTGKFNADFSPFVEECKKADAGLKAIDASAKTVEQSVTKFASAPVAPKLKLVEDSSRQTGTAIKDMGAAIGETDRIMAQFGITTGPVGGAITELGNALQQGTDKLGPFGTAALVASTAIGSWKLGTAIGEMTGLTERIRDGTAAWLGYGDAIGERAAAKADMLAKASATAGHAISDVTVAMAINQAEAERLINKNKGASASYLELAAAADAAKQKLDAIAASNEEKLRKMEFDFIQAGLKRQADAAAEAQKTKDAQAAALLAPSAPVDAATAARESAAADSAARGAAWANWAASQTTINVSGVFDVKDTTALSQAVAEGMSRTAGATRPYSWG